MADEIYRARILEHFQRPRHRGDLEGRQAVGRAAIPMCGDDIEVSVREAGTGRLAVRFRGRGCAVCIASASIMAEIVNGLDRRQAAEIGRAFTGWMLDGIDAAPLMTAAPELVETFAAVRAAGGRARCAALAWSAFADALRGCPVPPQTATGEAAGAAESARRAPG